MAEINGYTLSKEEEKACENLIKQMREKKVFAIDFTGCAKIKAKNYEEAQKFFWNWIGDIQDNTLAEWKNIFPRTPVFEYCGIEED